jgi:hypothetical protein
VQGVPVFITEKTVGEMFCLPQVEISTPLTIKQSNVAKICLKMVLKDDVLQKKGWKASQLEGKYVTRMLALMQAIWLKGN